MCVLRCCSHIVLLLLLFWSCVGKCIVSRDAVTSTHHNWTARSDWTGFYLIFVHLVCTLSLSLALDSDPSFRFGAPNTTNTVFFFGIYTISSDRVVCVYVFAWAHGIVHVGINNFNVCIELPRRISETGLFFPSSLLSISCIQFQFTLL